MDWQKTAWKAARQTALAAGAVGVTAILGYLADPANLAPILGALKGAPPWAIIMAPVVQAGAAGAADWWKHRNDPPPAP